MTEAKNKWQRIRYVGIKNFYTGTVVVMDTFKRRIETMKSRIFEWAMIVDLYRSKFQSRMVLVTLTYKKVEDYRPGHVGTYLKNLKTRLGKKLLAFAWVAELQQRGAVHYHVVLLVEPHTDIPKPDQGGYWTHGHSIIKTARTAYYLATYTGKQYQKDLGRYPKHCRLYATAIRPSLREKLGTDNPERFPKKPKIRTAEGEAVWSFVGAGVTKGYVETICNSEA